MPKATVVNMTGTKVGEVELFHLRYILLQTEKQMLRLPIKTFH